MIAGSVEAGTGAVRAMGDTWVPHYDGTDGHQDDNSFPGCSVNSVPWTVNTGSIRGGPPMGGGAYRRAMRLNARTVFRLAASAGKLLRRTVPDSRTTPTPHISYSPSLDGAPDPGEIVWTWVPYEEDASQGKDRPVLLIGRNGPRLVGLMLTTRDRNNASTSDDRYLDIGAGPWDPQGRPSEVKLDRIILIDPAGVRRIGALLPRARFDRVVAALRALPE